MIKVAHEAYSLFISENGLGPAAFPSLRTMEGDVIDMALHLQEAPENGYGAMTSGGSESCHKQQHHYAGGFCTELALWCNRPDR